MYISMLHTMVGWFTSGQLNFQQLHTACRAVHGHIAAADVLWKGLWLTDYILCRSFGCLAPVGTVYSINPAMIMTLVPLVGAAATHYSHFDMIHYGSYVSALSPVWMALFSTGMILLEANTKACVTLHTACSYVAMLQQPLCWQTVTGPAELS